MKKARFLAALGLSAAMFVGFSFSASAASVTDFKDVSPNAWYYNAVDYATDNNLFAGTGKDTFSPNTAMTRGMFVTVLGRKSGVPDTKPASTSFSDVKTADYFAPYVEWAANHGIVSGTGNGKFSPNDRISREQMAVIFYRYAQKTGNTTTVDENRYNGFSDTAKVSGYAVQGMKWATTHGIINGSDGRLDPKGTATRAQVAQVFFSAKDVLVKTEIQQQELPNMEIYIDSWTEDQNPYEILRQVIAGTGAKWDVTLKEGNSYQEQVIDFLDWGDTHYTADWAIFNTLELLNNTGADKFCIREPLVDGQPAQMLVVNFTVPDRQESELMAEAKHLISQEFPNARFEKMAMGHGWRGYMRADSDLSLAENAQRVANQEIRYLSEWYKNGDTFTYWISEPEPGKFYFFY